MINLKIDVTKIDKEKLFKGAKGTYLDAVLIETPNSEYADYMVVEKTSKDEYAKGVKGTILGSGKLFVKKEATEEAAQPTDTKEDNDDLPF